MLKRIFTSFVLPLILLFTPPVIGWSNSKKISNSQGESGTVQKMIVENASVTMQLDLNGLNGSSSLVARPVTLHFAAAPNSFFPILVFNDLLRGLEAGSMALVLQNSTPAGVNAPGYNCPLTDSVQRCGQSAMNFFVDSD